MGCWEPQDPEDEFKDWSKALITDDDKNAFSSFYEQITDDEVYDLLDGSDSMYAYADTVESDPDQNIETFKTLDDGKWYHFVRTEIAYNKMVATRGERQRTLTDGVTS